jgi:hypothetical protein
MSLQHTTGNLGRTQAMIVRQHPEAFRAMPLEGLFTLESIPELDAAPTKRFLDSNLIEIARGGRDQQPSLYKLSEPTAKWIRDNLQTADSLPCGHTGIRNLRRGGYSCTEESCDARYDRARIEAYADGTEGSR